MFWSTVASTLRCSPSSISQFLMHIMRGVFASPISSYRMFYFFFLIFALFRFVWFFLHW